MHLKKALVLAALCSSPALADASISVDAGGQRFISKTASGTVTSASATFKTSPLTTKYAPLPFDVGLYLRPEGAWGTVSHSELTTFTDNAGLYVCYKFAWFGACIDGGPSVLYMRNQGKTTTQGGYQAGAELTQGVTEDLFLRAAWHGAEYAPATARIRTSTVTLGLGTLIR